eukprot:1672836-Alexandrium_andersonii.AAC.1
MTRAPRTVRDTCPMRPAAQSASGQRAGRSASAKWVTIRASGALQHSRPPSAPLPRPRLLAIEF